MSSGTLFSPSSAGLLIFGDEIEMLLGIVRNGCRRALVVPNQLVVLQNAGICGKTLRGGPIQRPKPFPYKEKSYGVLQGFFDKTSWRFDENSKIVVVEGPIASGKTAFAKKLADELEMLYLPMVTMDDYYINEYGYDVRQLDSQLPKSVQSCDFKRYLEDPHNENVANFQITMLRLKYLQYIDAVCHLMNTGQGVVIERSCFGDKIFVETMYRAGYISKGARSVYYDLRKHTIPQLMKPHLVLYLDVPVAKVEENIKKRAIQYETKSKVLTKDYLTDLERNYKEQYLNEISEHAELLVYDWSEGGDVEVVVEDIERIDFDRFEKHDKKMKDWRFGREWDLCEQRIWYTKMRDRFDSYFSVPRIDVPELMIPADDYKVYTDVVENCPGNKYDVGYNADMGDKGILFRTSQRVRPSQWLK